MQNLRKGLGSSRISILVFPIGVFLLLALVTRLALLFLSRGEVGLDSDLVCVFGVGLLFDCATALVLFAPASLLLALLPDAALDRPLGRTAAHVALFAVLALFCFAAVAECVFWSEFSTRFNFIAIDYLVYTTEVLGNLRESYPLPWIFSGIAVFALALTLLCARRAWMLRASPRPREGLGERLTHAGAVLTGGLVVVATVSENAVPVYPDNYHRELAKNGLWSLAAAFRSNELDYDRFYPTLGRERAFARLRKELVEDGSLLLRPQDHDTLRYVTGSGAELRMNVVQITVESLSAKFLGAFDPSSTLTPNLDALAQESLFFERFYATGTRTDRGMEALSTSLPPTPGRSVVKRPDNVGLFTLGSVFRSKGYDTAFLYGGYGYFDNMNAYFGGNGYRVVDRASVAAEDVTFANAWGACDEDLFRWTMREADRVSATGQPFHFFVMTTSNHRPFTYPEGRIDLEPKKSGRSGAVKYTDHAIGAFLREAATRPWYRNTIFVVVADHCAASAGKAELAVDRYHIPLLIFAPGGQVPPGRVTTLTSQMDYAPTLLGCLGWSYPSRFFGHDVLRIAPSVAHALVGNYQKLGHLEGDDLVVLSPKRGPANYAFDLATGRADAQRAEVEAEIETIAYYEAASAMYSDRSYTALGTGEIERMTREGEALRAARASGASSTR